MRKENGQFKKGNPGKPKGAKNKITEDIRQFVSDLLDENRQQIIDDLKELEPFDRVRVFEKFLAYVLPKQRATDFNLNVGQLTDDQIKQISNELLKNLE